MKIEILETSSWEPENQCGCDVTNSHWILLFFPIMPNKRTIFIKLLHKMIVNIINKYQIKFVNCVCVCMLLRNKLSLIVCVCVPFPLKQIEYVFFICFIDFDLQHG